MLFDIVLVRQFVVLQAGQASHETLNTKCGIATLDSRYAPIRALSDTSVALGARFGQIVKGNSLSH